MQGEHCMGYATRGKGKIVSHKESVTDRCMGNQIRERDAGKMTERNNANNAWFMVHGEPCKGA